MQYLRLRLAGAEDSPLYFIRLLLGRLIKSCSCAAFQFAGQLSPLGAVRCIDFISARPNCKLAQWESAACWHSPPLPLYHASSCRPLGKCTEYFDSQRKLLGKQLEAVKWKRSREKKEKQEKRNLTRTNATYKFLCQFVRRQCQADFRLSRGGRAGGGGVCCTLVT